MTLNIIIATTNPAKADRLQSLCTGVDVRFVEPHHPSLLIDESSPTHLGNAIAKALSWSRVSPDVALASDGGLVIPALGDKWESTLTHRATGADVEDSERARRLLSRMRGIDWSQRSAYWVEAIAVARAGSLTCAWEVDGLLGVIGENYRANPDGPKGFWGDGLWETIEGKKRWELSDYERNEKLDTWYQLFAPVNAFLARMT